MSAANAAPKAFTRRDHLRSIEKRVQEKWEKEHIFEANEDSSKEKFFVTFPYPYMNGRLHLGHAFSATKAEFSARYQRMLGKNVLFPFGFHCTGMPIQAAANKLKEEIQQYGNPPVFPAVVEAVAAAPEADAAAAVANKQKGKKTKLEVKGQTGPKRQWDILSSMVDPELIPEFAAPEKWLSYFPPYGVSDLKAFGASIDWRRSFITTAKSEYYDAFIRWQFNKLREAGRIKSGFRPNIYSIKDKQVCADHDRASGESIVPQEYTIVKLLVLPKAGSAVDIPALQGKQVYLAPATLRPETMYGQTNCYVLPEGDYGAFEFTDGVYIVSERAARGLAHQGYARDWGTTVCLARFKGSDLLGLPLSAPHAAYEVIYTLPLLTISMGKGTGVVTSVPSDAPDDYVALKELKDKPAWREKFGLTADMVEPFEVVPIIDIPGYGTTAAATLCEERGVKSSKDKDKLKEIKDEVYLKGFYEGVLLVGDCAGMKVCDAKPVIRKAMMEQGTAMSYFEPEGTVMSRSGDECIVALTDQWYLSYGESDWQAAVQAHINSAAFNSYNAGVLDAFNGAVGWLKEWACSREFGLGTRLPWDSKWVIDSLSDSTIYMAYYTIAHFFHGGSGEFNLAGSAEAAGIAAADLTDEVFSFVFLGHPLSTPSAIPQGVLDKMRGEFEYWYRGGMDLRVSAKDLIPNHLTMCLYNHMAVWPQQPDRWPRGMFCNGHILVDAEKMSKSRGNFLMLLQCVEDYSADATRFALADAGDGLEDPNFDRSVANQAVSYLFVEDEWISAFLLDEAEGRTRGGAADELSFMDRAFANEISVLVEATGSHFNGMRFREGLHTGWYDMIIARDLYRDWATRCGRPLHGAITRRFVEALLLMMQPITPHWSEAMFEKVFGPTSGSVCMAAWPAAQPVDALLRKEYGFLKAFIKGARLAALKVKGKAGQGKTARVFVAKSYEDKRVEVLRFLQQQPMPLPATLPKDMKAFLEARDDLRADTMALMQFGMFMKDEVAERGPDALSLELLFDQAALLREHADYIKSVLELTDLQVFEDGQGVAPEDRKKADAAVPGKPSYAIQATN